MDNSMLDKVLGPKPSPEIAAFIVKSGGFSSANCPHKGCDWWTHSLSERIAAGDLVAHLNFTHDQPPVEEAL